MLTTEFFIEGEPIPQGSMKAFVRGRRAVLVSDNPRLKAWRDTVEANAPLLMLEGAVRLDVEFVLPKPKSVHRLWPHVRPDLDKLVRALCDGLTGRCFKDDSQVVFLTARKVYGNPAGVSVKVSGYDEPAVRALAA